MKHILPHNVGFTLDKVPSDILGKLKTLIADAYDNPSDYEKHQHLVSGHIKNELILGDDVRFIEPYIMDLAMAHDKEFNYLNTCTHVPKPFDMELSEIWVNFQEKGEFNPAHCHMGIYSFVFWVDVPYTFEGEQALLPEAGGLKSGKFEFLYTNTLGQIGTHTLDTDSQSEGFICLFPSNMRHLVYPFASSDKLRVTVAGNLKVADS